ETSGADAALVLVGGDTGPTAGPTLGPGTADADELAAVGAAELLDACRATARALAATPDVRAPLLVPSAIANADPGNPSTTPAIRVVGLALDAGAERLRAPGLGVSAAPRLHHAK